VAEVSRVSNGDQAQRWNGESGRYWIANRKRHLAEHQHLVPHLFSAAGISPGEHVLDIGCGCGETTVVAARAAGGAEAGPGGFAIGLDLSRPMLAVARRLAMQTKVPNIGFVQGDAQTCPLRQGSCNVMISSFGVMFFEDPATAFACIANAICRGGRLAFLCWQHDRCNDLLAIPLHAFGAHTQLPNPTASDLFVDPQQVTELLSITGWDNIEIHAVNESAWMGSDAADVMSYVRGMPTIRALVGRLRDEAVAERAFATIAEQYAGCQRPDGVWVRAAAWLVTANRV
jgi:ubiquinone/menaquinone biosynthesis C-methylase UbiE